jgi:SAM-dependent methyltransferase
MLVSAPVRDEGVAPQASKASTLTYHQGQALVANIGRYLDEARASSLLDIGAGAGNVAVPLARRVRKYLAVESDSGRAAQLLNLGLAVLQERFPTPIVDCFDFVLASHSIPERLEDLPPFLEAAWQAMRPAGIFLIITFKGSCGTIASLRRELTGVDAGASPHMDCVKETFSHWGRTRVETVNSYAEAEDAEDMVAFFESWLSGRAERRAEFRDKFRRIIESRFRVRPNLYVLPTEHVFVSCLKPE